jgi:phospholipid/cholesterol/gamma-HCH transport system permease protein
VLLKRDSVLGDALATARGIFLLSLETTFAILRGRFRFKEVIRQGYLIGNQSLVFVLGSLAFVAMESVVQAGVQSQRLLGSANFQELGAVFLQLMIRESGPTIAALMLATRVGAGIAAEIGAMKVTEQVEALRMNEADPVEYLIAPRVIACGFMMVCITVYCILVAEITGALTAAVSFEGNFQAFFNFQRIELSDVAMGFIKAVWYGVSIPIVAGQAGLSAFGGSAGVGNATTRAVVATSLVVIIEDFIVSVFGYLFLMG